MVLKISVNRVNAIVICNTVFNLDTVLTVELFGEVDGAAKTSNKFPRNDRKIMRRIFLICTFEVPKAAYLSGNKKRSGIEVHLACTLIEVFKAFYVMYELTRQK